MTTGGPNPCQGNRRGQAWNASLRRSLFQPFSRRYQLLTPVKGERSKSGPTIGSWCIRGMPVAFLPTSAGSASPNHLTITICMPITNSLCAYSAYISRETMASTRASPAASRVPKGQPGPLDGLISSLILVLPKTRFHTIHTPRSRSDSTTSLSSEPIVCIDPTSSP